MEEILYAFEVDYTYKLPFVGIRVSDVDVSDAFYNDMSEVIVSVAPTMIEAIAKVEEHIRNLPDSEIERVKLIGEAI